MKKFTTILAVAGGLFFSAAAHATNVTYEFSFTAADMMNYVIVDGADGSTAVDNSLFDGARLTREGGSPYIRSYIETQNDAFETWATSTTHTMNAFNIWGFDGLGAKWGDDYKHTNSLITDSASGWATYDAGWLPAWGANPNPYTFVSPGWYVEDTIDGFDFDDTDLADQVFTFELSFNTTDWLFGADTNGAPNTLGGPMTFWFGGWMGDDTGAYQYIYEGNLVLTGTRVPEPAPMALLGLGLLAFGVARKRRG